jgi:hypothetical protein
MELHQLARDDVVSTSDATKLGIGPSELRRLLRAGQLRRLIRGWYAVRRPGSVRAPWEGVDRFDTERRRHLLLVIALLRSFDGRVVASHQSALVLHGLPLWRSDLRVAHVCRTADDHTRQRPSASIHPACGSAPVLALSGHATVPVAHAVIQVGLVPTSSAGRPFPLESLVVADAALHRGLVTTEELTRTVEVYSGHPGITGVRSVLAHADARHESVGETRLAHALRILGHRFTPQVEVEAEGMRWRTDFELDDDPVVIEFDGLAKYSGDLAQPTADQLRRALAAEKWREDRLRDTGREVVRFVWGELDDLGLIGSRVDAAVARSRRRGRS